MRQGNRRSTPKVVKGRVQKKNNWSLSTDYYDAPEPRTVVIDRKRPAGLVCRAVATDEHERAATQVFGESRGDQRLSEIHTPIAQ